ncbi:sensor histidine kinase [Cohnella sp. GCM10027633]|uniref:sensor histidine kinase n=1 Tax=unclassified Cohnella TaxID=2636738 RepID=UPI003645CCF0
MKLWLKIVIFTILPFILVVGAASYMVIERNHGKLLQQAAESGLNESLSIRSSIEAIAPALQLYDSRDYDKTAMADLANIFVTKHGEQRDYLEISSSALGIVYTNMDFDMPKERRELTGLTTEETRYMIRDVGERTLLFTANKIIVNGQDYVLSYLKDVTAIYEERTDQYRFFLRVDAIACLLFMLVMYLVSKGLTKPIDRMVRTAQVIAGGDFSGRVKATSKDEIGVLANNFNEMADVVETKISELERNNSEKQRFINNITHELKTPLTSIIAYADFLRVTKYDEGTFLDGLQVIHGEARRLEALSGKLMDLILLGKEERAYLLQSGRLSEIVAAAKPQMELNPKAVAKNVRFVLELSEDSHPEVMLDPDLVHILILNLVDNAVKASVDGGRIWVRTRCEDYVGDCVLEVADEGTGIAPEHRDHIFEPFYMADQSRTTSRTGTGLGLSICKSIADIHRAKIEVASELGKGTTIRVVFGEQARVRRKEART